MVPCNTDIATQTIIRFASEVDPDGKRTLGVLTKPDLAVETATQHAVAELIRGRRRDLQLGYCVVRNRGADDQASTIDIEARDAAERTFFGREPWSKLDPTRIGIPALRSRLRELLMDRTKSEFPNVKREIQAQLKEADTQLRAMGDARSKPDEQRTYLGKIASEYSELMRFGLDAYYTGDPIFIKRQDLRLITRVRELNEAFATVFFSKGHSLAFEVESHPDKKDRTSDEDEDDDNYESTDEDCSEPGGSNLERGALYPISFSIPTDHEDDLDGILAESFACADPSGQSLMDKIEKMYKSYRGYELGTVRQSLIRCSS